MIPHLNRSRGMDLKRGEQEKKSTGKKKQYSFSCAGVGIERKVSKKGSLSPIIDYCL
jgi:hypothetical protein